MKRLFDVFVVVAVGVLVLVPFCVIALLVRLTSPGPVLYWSDRVGRGNRIFQMPKYRSMRTDTPAVATHLLQNPDVWLTPIGSFLRRTSLDELPQLWSILIGDMSLVGPRPMMLNQQAIYPGMAYYRLRPGITGYWQTAGRNRTTFEARAEYDAVYEREVSFVADAKILVRTVSVVTGGTGC